MFVVVVCENTKTGLRRSRKTEEVDSAGGNRTLHSRCRGNPASEILPDVRMSDLVR
jgi:hypothetical protein